MTSMLFRIWVWACSDIGRTAPTNLPDSISSREGIPSPGSFSRSFRKLAKGDLLCIPLRAIDPVFSEGELSRYTESIPHA